MLVIRFSVGCLLNALTAFFRVSIRFLHLSLNHGLCFLNCFVEVFGIVSSATVTNVLVTHFMGSSWSWGFSLNLSKQRAWKAYQLAFCIFHFWDLCCIYASLEVIIKGKWSLPQRSSHTCHAKKYQQLIVQVHK